MCDEVRCRLQAASSPHAAPVREDWRAALPHGLCRRRVQLLPALLDKLGGTPVDGRLANLTGWRSLESVMMVDQLWMEIRHLNRRKHSLDEVERKFLQALN